MNNVKCTKKKFKKKIQIIIIVKSIDLTSWEDAVSLINKLIDFEINFFSYNFITNL